MRRLILVFAVVGVSILMVGGVALAVSRVGGPEGDILKGTAKPDEIDGRGGNDKIFGQGGETISETAGPWLEASAMTRFPAVQATTTSSAAWISVSPMLTPKREKTSFTVALAETA